MSKTKTEKLGENILNGIIIGLLLGAFSVIFLLFFKISKPVEFSSNLTKVISIILLIISLIGVLAIHELGHLLVGLIRGFKFYIYVVGFLGIRRSDNGKIQFYFNKEWNYFGGIAGTFPTNDNPDNPKIFAHILIAGPISSFLLSLLCLIAAYNLSGILNLLFEVWAFASFAIFLATTIPNQTGVFFTDRKRFQRLKSDGKAQKTELALLRIVATSIQNDNYKYLNPVDFETIKKDDADFMQYLGTYYAMLYYTAQNLKDKISAEQNIYNDKRKFIPDRILNVFEAEFEKNT